MKSLRKINLNLSKKPLIFGITLFTLFLLLTFLVSIGLTKNFDLLVTKNLQAIFPNIVDLPFSLFSLFGSAEIVLLLLLALKLIYRKLNTIYVLVGFVIFHAVELFSKTFVEQIAPSHSLVRYYFDFSLPSSGVNPGFAYPSGHMGRTIFLSLFIIFIIKNSKRLSSFKKNILYVLIISLVLIMFISRVYLAEHWFTDVLGGAILGASIAILTLSI